MKYNRFKELWDTLVGDHSKPKNHPSGIQLVDTMNPKTAQALIEYGQGNTTIFDEVKEKWRICRGSV